jgi:cytochrome c-type biogenesis protein CcmH/NrfG
LDESSVSAKGRVVWLRVLWAWVAVALVLFGLLMTSSRGAWLACAVAGLLGGLWWLIVPLEPNGKGQRWIALGLAVAGLIVAVVIGTLWLVAEEISFVQFFDPGTWLNRLEFQRNSLILAKDYVLTGAGLDGFMMLYSTYALLIHVGFIFSSYNLLLAIAIDQGLLGVLALVWMWVMFAVVAWRHIGRPKQDSNQKTDRASLVRIAALSMLIVVLHGTVDTALYGRGVLFLFVPLTFAVPTAPQEEHQVQWQRALSLIVVGIPICLALLWPQRSLSLVHSSLGSVYQSQAELSVYSWPEWPLQDEVRRQVDMSRSVSEFEKALALDPQNATANRRLGMIELSLGEYQDALVHLKAAYAAEPHVATTRQLLGEALIVNGYVEEGQALWSDVNTEQGQLDARIFWYQYIGDAERAAWIEQAAKSH